MYYLPTGDLDSVLVPIRLRVIPNFLLPLHCCINPLESMLFNLSLSWGFAITGNLNSDSETETEQSWNKHFICDVYDDPKRNYKSMRMTWANAVERQVCAWGEPDKLKWSRETVRTNLGLPAQHIWLSGYPDHGDGWTLQCAETRGLGSLDDWHLLVWLRWQEWVLPTDRRNPQGKLSRLFGCSLQIIIRLLRYGITIYYLGIKTALCWWVTVSQECTVACGQLLPHFPPGVSYFIQKHLSRVSIYFVYV